jgi:hypothetical protein
MLIASALFVFIEISLCFYIPYNGSMHLVSQE